MPRTRSGVGNNNMRNDHPEPRIAPAAEPITREEIQTMMQTLLAQQREETRLLLEQNVARLEARVPVNE